MDQQGPNGPFRSPAVQPEILPPEESAGSQSYAAPDYDTPVSDASPQRRARSRWAIAPATYLLVAINIVVFLPAMFNPPLRNLIMLRGANWGVGELAYGQWWRLLTATFIHNGIIHLATNMWCLWNLGLLGEPLLGSPGLVLTYLLTGMGGFLLSTGIHPEQQAVGASGAIFGLAGVLIVLLKSPLLPVPQSELRDLRRSVIYFAGLNLVIGLATAAIPSIVRIDNMAHLGGFLCGLAVAMPMVPRIGSRRVQFVRRQWLAFTALAGVLLLAGFYLVNFYALNRGFTR